jgi:hypothetical protein
LLKKEQLTDIYCAIMVQHDADEKVYYTNESVAQAPNFTCHAPSAITIGSGIM